MKRVNIRVKKILVVFGTRPEAIKMAPLVKLLEKNSLFDTKTCVTAQHREMLDDVLSNFSIVPSYDLNLMKNQQDLWGLTSNIMEQTKLVYQDYSPNLVLVHGDTTTAFASALSAFYASIDVGHVEAGLRSFDNRNPFPEEINRVMIDNISTIHFAPTETAVKNLMSIKVPKDSIFLTGNTVIDSLLLTEKKVPFIRTRKKIILLTIHRRENFGDPSKKIMKAILKLVDENSDIEVIFPVHPNPNIKRLAYELLSNKERISLRNPQSYGEFVSLMKSSYIIITDSGGIQEEAPSIGKPVLVVRTVTERPEAVESGNVKLVGNETNNIVNVVTKLLKDNTLYERMSKINHVYGDGTASEKIIDAISQYYEK